jgi:hypothetical protein
VVAAFLASSLPAQANHPQEGLTFDSLGGNEWWVDLQMTGDLDHYGYPEVRDSDGVWTYMDHPSWAGPGRYVLSYHVEPGHKVKFRASYRDSVVVSCWFSHPAGVESCDGAETFSASFLPSGSSESIRVQVTGTQPIGGVNWQVMGTQGAWTGPTMYRVSGSPSSSAASTWGSNLHVPDGEVFKFIARSTDDWSASTESGCYRWPTATAVACPNSDYLSVQTPTSYDGNLTHMEAHAYWSPWPDQTKGLDSLDVRFDGGTFHTMRLDHVGDGSGYNFDRFYRYDQAPTRAMSIAQFRGKGSDGVMHCEPTAYFWPPQGYPDRINTGPGQDIIFTNVQGTTSWVQTNLYSSKPVVAVEVSVNGGPFKAMQQQPWCDWGLAMSSTSGSVVFRGFFPDLASFTSEAFSWNPSGGTTFGAQFFEVGGNEWWEQVSVNAFGGTLSRVDVRVNGGAWNPLAKQSWGNNMWAGSYRAPPGSAVQFQVTSTGGDKAVSPCYQWLPSKPAQTTTCPTGGGGTTFDATYSGVKGNDWWVQTSVAVTGGTLAGVDARVNCAGTWHPLAKQSYGWSASFNVPAGSKVDFRARSTTGATDLSGGYVWPNATPTSAC